MSLPLSCLLLTAGLGSRLDPLTRLVAKPAVPLGDRSLVEHVIDWLHREGIRDLVLNLHHLPSTITAIVGDGHHLGVCVRYSWEQPILGSAGGPRHALPLLDSDPFLIVNGDTLCPIDLGAMWRAHGASGADVTMAVIRNPNPAHYNGIRADRDRVLLGFVPRGHREETWHFVGVQITRKSVFAGLRDGEPAETVAGLYREMAALAPGRIRIWPVETSFLDVGTAGDYLTAAHSLGGTRSGSVLWPGVTVESGVLLSGCVVAGDVHLPRGFTATSSVIVPASLARPGDQADTRDGVAVFPLRAGQSA